jgi:UDP-2-acetamido-3-amino-2,3-dideoxy-glucuronate N-acetyltransferase
MSQRCALVRLERYAEERGCLHVAQVGGALPFVVRRFYLIGDVPDGTIRGLHGHRTVHQLLVAVRGRVGVELKAGGASRHLVLDHPGIGLHITPSVWSSQQFFDAAMLLVLSSEEFDPPGYLFDPREMSGDVGHD